MGEIEDILPEPKFEVEEYKLPKEKQVFWDIGHSNGRAFMQEEYNYSGGRPVNGESLRGFKPTDEVIEECMQRSGLTFIGADEKRYYSDAFKMACDQGWPYKDM